MRIRQANVQEEAPINLMPLLDMVFLLLIFFLIATTFAQEERDTSIQLPGTSMAEPMSAPPQQVIINIRADGTMVIGPRTYKTLKSLGDMLTRVAREDRDREILIRCDEVALHKYFAAVVRICRQAGINEVKIGYMLAPSTPAGTQ